MKNLIYAGIIVICLGVAAYVMFAGGSDEGGVGSFSNEEQVWVLCMACKHSYQMGKKDYYEQLQEEAKKRTNRMAVVYLPCEKCGESAVIEAIKCEKCGHVFRKSSVPGDLPDRCPKCKYSKTEAIRKERLNQ